VRVRKSTEPEATFKDAHAVTAIIRLSEPEAIIGRPTWGRSEQVKDVLLGQPSKNTE
jgi:hypothetical protein